MTKLITKRSLPLLIMLCLLIMFAFITLFSEATFDAGDGIRHYLISKYSWRHPHLLLDSWGKPFFTIISSPFSQFGLTGIIFFNIICALVSSWVCYKIALRQGIQSPVFVILFLCFTPCYFASINSGLTEPFFGLVLILSIYLLITQHYLFSTVLISFLPFVRTEGIVIIPLFFCLLILKRKLKYIPFLVFGTFLYSIVGSLFYYHDLLWIKHNNPYNGLNKIIYGHGELLHFVKNYDFIWGVPLVILFLAGLIYIVFSQQPSNVRNSLVNFFSSEEVILIIGSFAAYFVAHSIMWWKGLANSLGLLRVMAAIAPCSALICLRGFNLLLSFLQRKVLSGIFTSVLLILIILYPFNQPFFPFKLDPEQRVIKETGDWFRSSNFHDKKIYYLYPYLAHVLNVDPFNPEKVSELWGLYPTINNEGIGTIPDSTVIFWDAHFGPNECHIPLDNIMNDPHFEFIKSFKPKNSFTTLGGYNFEVVVFFKTDKKKPLSIVDSIQHGFESNTKPEWQSLIVNEKAFSGSSSIKVLKDIEYSVAFEKSYDSFVNIKTLAGVELSAKIWYDGGGMEDNLVVLSIDDSLGNNFSWDGKRIELSKEKDEKGWRNLNAHFTTHADLNSKYIAKLYVWNKAKKEFYIDDVKIYYVGQKLH